MRLLITILGLLIAVGGTLLTISIPAFSTYAVEARLDRLDATVASLQSLVLILYWLFGATLMILGWVLSEGGKRL